MGSNRRPPACKQALSQLSWLSCSQEPLTFDFVSGRGVVKRSILKYAALPQLATDESIEPEWT
ncbi:hypothetical protein KCP75_21980 [Salmonella enterica subsp. enterica]|nr:hypothetical protein KCP75_21980 [Salmonella enterica subsp. enterica]